MRFLPLFEKRQGAGSKSGRKSPQTFPLERPAPDRVRWRIAWAAKLAAEPEAAEIGGRGDYDRSLMRLAQFLYLDACGNQF